MEIICLGANLRAAKIEKKDRNKDNTALLYYLWIEINYTKYSNFVFVRLLRGGGGKGLATKKKYHFLKL